MYNPIRNLEDFNRYAVNRKDQIEVVRQSLYSFETYVMAGQSTLTFFANPVGSGGRTLADTNMTLAGQIPSGQRYALQTMEVYFIPGVFPSAANAAPGIDNHVNDIWEVYTSDAWLELKIGSKPYLQEAPLVRMPPSTRLIGFAGLSDSTTAAAAQFQRTSHIAASGAVYRIEPVLLLEPNQNFSVTVNWPALVPISVSGTLGVVMGGVQARNSQ